jgi:hypothetical protein
MTSLSTMKTIDYIGIDVSKKTLQIDAASLAPTCPNQAKALHLWLRQLPARAHLVLEASGGYEKLWSSPGKVDCVGAAVLVLVYLVLLFLEVASEEVMG